MWTATWQSDEVGTIYDYMKARVKFDRPPVVEVVCGVLFSTPAPIIGAQIGLFWQTIRDAFPRLEEAPPISSIIENIRDQQTPDIQIGTLPPLRRTWLLSNDGRTLIQIQEDRFLFNWKRAEDEDTYPSYERVIEPFDRYLAMFVKFLVTEGVGEPVYRQFELTYVNHIGNMSELVKVGETGVLVDHIRDSSRDRFLPLPEGFNWTTAYSLPDNAGRLRLTAQTALRQPKGERIVRFDLTARGIPADTSEAGRRPWFDLAHDWITHGFADTTSPILHRDVWRRTS